MKTEERTVHNECYSCIHKRSVPGDAHIKCVKPDRGMTGHPHGTRNGWFMYPVLFDPMWKMKMCDNHEQPPPVSPFPVEGIPSK